jgi:streptogramin lyase
MLGRIKPTGSITLYPIGGNFSANSTMQFGARGPDGEPWFANASGDTVLRVNTATQTVTTFNPPLASGENPEALTAGSDGNIWVDTVGAHHIDVLAFNPMTVTPTSLKFTGTGLVKNVTVAENGVTAWTATSSNVAVATVAQGGSATVFKVTSTGVGTCKVTIADGVGNSVAVKVTVL